MRTNTDVGINTDWKVNDIVKPTNMNALTKSIQYDYVVTEDMIYDASGEVDIDELLGGDKIKNVSGAVSVLINASSVASPENLVLKFPAISSGLLSVHVYLRYSAYVKVEGASGGVTYYFHTCGETAADGVVARLKGVGMHTYVGVFYPAQNIDVPDNGTFVYETRAPGGTARVRPGEGATIQHKAWMSNDMFNFHAHKEDVDRVATVITPEDDQYGIKREFGYAHKSNMYGGTFNLTSLQDNPMIIGGEGSDGRPCGDTWDYQPTLKIGLTSHEQDVHPYIDIKNWKLNRWLASGGTYCYLTFFSQVQRQYGVNAVTTTLHSGEENLRDASGNPISDLPTSLLLADGVNFTVDPSIKYRAVIDICVNRIGHAASDRCLMAFHYDIIIWRDNGSRAGWWTGYHGEAGSTMKEGATSGTFTPVLYWLGKGYFDKNPPKP